MLYNAKKAMSSSVLPSLALSMFTMASIARFTRSEMMEVLGSDYMLLAESKGISGPALIFRHVPQKRHDSYYYGAGAADCRFNDRLTGCGKDFCHPRSRKPFGKCHSVQ